MMIRPMPSTLLSLLLFAAVGCGGAGKPVETGGSSSSDVKSSGSDKPGSGTSDSEGSADNSGTEDAKAAAADAPAGDKTNIAAGLQMLDRRSLTLDFDLNLIKNGQGMGVQSGNWSFSEERTLRVKVAKKDVITELQVVYGKWDAKPLLGLTYEMPTDGKTYLLANNGSHLTITRGASDHVSAGEEQRTIKAEYGWVGERSPLRQALLASKLEPGSNLGKSQELAQLILGEIPGADSSQSELSATLDKVEGGARKKALLKIEAKAKVTSNKTFFALELNGTAAVDVATGWVVAADLAGTTQATGSVKHPKKGELEVTGKGKVTLTRKGEFK
jgi:hypothetical protein